MDVGWITVVESIVAFLSVILNAFVLYSTCRSVSITIHDIFIVHLAIAGIFLGLVYIPHILYQINILHFDFWECISVHSIILMADNICIIMLLCVSGQRLFAVRFPLRYRVTDKKNANRFLLIVWAVSISIGTVPWFWNNGSENYSECQFALVISRKFLFYFNFLTVNGICVVAIVCIYIYIKTHLRRLKNRETITPKSVRRYLGPVVLMSSVAVLTLPIHIMDTLFYFEVIDISENTLLAASACAALKTFNSTVNPFIYASVHFFPSQNINSSIVTSTLNPLINATLFQSQNVYKMTNLAATKNLEPSKQEIPTSNLAMHSSRRFSVDSRSTQASADDSCHSLSTTER